MNIHLFGGKGSVWFLESNSKKRDSHTVFLRDFGTHLQKTWQKIELLKVS